MRLCYRAYGGASGTPLLLIAGLGLQLISWPEAFVQALVTAGYWVIAPDNRDVGKSFRVGTRPPGKLRQILRWPPPDSYSLDDMADDMTRLLQSLEIPAAHVIGMSMGGMIGQTLASRHAERVLTLTSIFSTTGAVDVGQPALSALLRQDRSESRTSSEATNRYVNIMRYVGDPQAPGIESEWSAYALRAWERNGNRANASGSGRQIGAILKSGDRTAQLRRIKAPTLVIHGDRDLLVHPSGGAATAAAIPGARLVTVPGLRHQIDSMRSPELAGLIVRHIKESTKALGLTVNERT
ncbi:alpha/beta fold hydrolase [Paraburkholderia saeva]|nr:alpha/beta hydrolase [Paraburkholderia saeva]